MKLTSWLQGLALGAGAMYLLDPDKGNRRRALIRDQAIHQANVKKKALKVMQRDFKNRSQGLIHEIQGRFEADATGETVLAERVRSAMGRCCSHTQSIEVSCSDGEVTLTGPVMANEVLDLIGTVKNVRGVTRVINNLEVQSSDEAMASASQRANTRLAPGECLLAVGAGTILSIYGLGRRGIVGWLMGFGGAAMIAKGFRDTEHRFDCAPNPGQQQSSSTESAPQSAQVM